LKYSEGPERRARIFFAISALALVLAFALFSYKPSEIFSEVYCERIDVSGLHCRFSCEILPKSPGQLARMTAIHSSWSAVFAEEARLPAKIEIDLPKREYNYTLFVNTFDSKGRVGYGKPIHILEC